MTRERVLPTRDVLTSELDGDRPHEECGVVGVSGVEGAAELSFLALYALQHRGQESAGICAIEDGKARLHKGLGLVADVFAAERLIKLPG